MKIFVSILFCFILVACADNYTNQASYAESQRERRQQSAAEGDAEAQFQMGNAYCCDDQKGGFFSTADAIAWWCKAAQQGHTEAIKSLGVYGNGQSCQP